MQSSKKFANIVTLSIVIFYSSLVVLSNRLWKDDLTVHQRVLRYTSGRNPIRKDLIDDYLERGQYQEAFAEIQEFAKYYRDFALLDIVWGNYYFFTNDTNLAVESYEAALRGNKHFFLYYRLSACYRKLKKQDEAIEYGLASYRINPHFTPNLLQLAELYTEKKEYNRAREFYNIAYGLSPRDPALKILSQNAK